MLLRTFNISVYGIRLNINSLLHFLCELLVSVITELARINTGRFDWQLDLLQVYRKIHREDKPIRLIRVHRTQLFS